jgi:hypothetical protein
MHFWSGAQQNLGLEEHETLNLVEHGYELMYRTWGPSLLRRLDVLINGYVFSKQSPNPLLRDHRSRFFKKQAGLIWTLLPAMQRYAPNGIVRRRARRIDERFRALIGEPTRVMSLLALAAEALASIDRTRRLFDPALPGPKQEPFKRYVFDKVGNGSALRPYHTEWPARPSVPTWLAMQREKCQYAAIEKVLRGARLSSRTKADPLIDDYLIQLVATRSFGFGL